LKVFENRVLRIFGPKREEVAGGWRGLYNEKLHNLVRFTKYYCGNRFKESGLGWAGLAWPESVARMGEMRNSYKILVGKPEETTWNTKT